MKNTMITNSYNNVPGFLTMWTSRQNRNPALLSHLSIAPLRRKIFTYGENHFVFLIAEKASYKGFFTIALLDRWIDHCYIIDTGNDSIYSDTLLVYSRRTEKLEK